MKLLPWRTWLDQFETETAHLGERLLGMDRHAPQKTPTFRAQMTTDNIVPVYTPWLYRPVDHHVGARLKQIMGLFYHLEVEAHRDSWCMPPGLGGLQAWQRRARMATWLAAAWTMVKDDAPFFRSAFVSTGFLIALDGSENNMIKLNGVPDYDFTKSE